MRYFPIVAALALLAPGAAYAQSDDTPATAPSINAHYTLNTPIKVLIADPEAKAVLDKDLPGMSSDENLSKFEDKSLVELQPMSGGQLTDALMKKVAADLAATGGAPADDAAAVEAAPPSAPMPAGR